MKKNEEQKIEVRTTPLSQATIRVPIKGKTPLLMGKMDQAIIQEIVEKQSGKKMATKKIRDTEKEYKNSIHRTSTGIIGFPSGGFKGGMIDSAPRVGNRFFSKGLVMGGIRIINAIEGLIPIKYKKMDCLQHSVGAAKTMFSPQFHDWSCELVIQYDANNISASDIVNLLNYAGFYVGIGVWRPKGKDGGSGEFGCYEVGNMSS
jgi:hypothetical protein